MTLQTIFANQPGYPTDSCCPTQWTGYPSKTKTAASFIVGIKMGQKNSCFPDGCQPESVPWSPEDNNSIIHKHHSIKMRPRHMTFKHKSKNHIYDSLIPNSHDRQKLNRRSNIPVDNFSPMSSFQRMINERQDFKNLMPSFQRMIDERQDFKNLMRSDETSQFIGLLSAVKEIL